MTFLLMDTSGEYAVLGLAEDDGVLRASRVFAARRTLSRRLLGEVDGLLTGEGLTLADMSALAVGIGPGSFTGVRVGATTAKTLAQVTGKPLVGVGTLDAYAAVWPEGATVVPVLHSRRGEVYAAVYRGNVSVEGAFAPAIADLDSKLEVMERQGPIIVCGAVGLLARRPRLSLAQPYVPPEGLARLAARRLEGGTDDPLALRPLYVVPPSISTPKNAFVLPQEAGA